MVRFFVRVRVIRYQAEGIQVGSDSFQHTDHPRSVESNKLRLDIFIGPKHARSFSCPTKLNTLALFLVPLLPLPRLRENLSVRTERFQANARKLATYCLKSSSTNAISPTCAFPHASQIIQV